MESSLYASHYIWPLLSCCHHRNSGDGGINILTLKIRKLVAEELNSFPTLPRFALFQALYGTFSILFPNHIVPLATSIASGLINVFFKAYLTTFIHPHWSLSIPIIKDFIDLVSLPTHAYLWSLTIYNRLILSPWMIKYVPEKPLINREAQLQSYHLHYLASLSLTKSYLK